MINEETNDNEQSLNLEEDQQVPFRPLDFITSPEELPDIQDSADGLGDLLWSSFIAVVSPPVGLQYFLSHLDLKNRIL